MNWNRFAEIIDDLPTEIEQFLKNNKDKNLLIFESSGIGKNLNSIIDNLEKDYCVHRIYMEPPDEFSIQLRMKTRKNNVGTLDQEIRYTVTWSSKVQSIIKKYKLPLLTYTETIIEINRLLDQYKGIHTYDNWKYIP